MREPHPDGGRRLVSSSGASTHDSRGQFTTTYTSPPWPHPQTRTHPTTHAAARITSPISPPTSPPPPSCLNLDALPHHPVDMLAYRLRNQSISHKDPGSVSASASAALSPTSLADDNDFPNSTPMEVDPADDDVLEPAISIPSRSQRRAYGKGLGIMVPTSPSGPDNTIIQPSPSATDPAAVIRAQAGSSAPTLYGPEFDLVCPELEVDEGYCEDDDDFLWLESVVSTRDVPALSSGMPEGIKKRYGLRYRTSTEAATRCANAIHSVPRMRRRDKRRRKSSRVPDLSSITDASFAT
ncbi:hypothetical protein AK830_g10261 [Neonectria ditissima]|uniref:Uncharacterized protein n=1 Tax=Neonectria ditissima TaxID=78410 RepID=A0A0P7AQC7_9HYPO|nr:hypothetical protein AK830_g10261 [Neonectria ditissima]